MKKIIIYTMILFSVFLITGCSNKDSLKFKNEYESLNGTIREKDGHKIRKITIDKNNNIIYKKDTEIVDMIKNKESFIVYFGFSDCPWCRSVLPTLLEEAKNAKIKKIYYVDVKEIRDEMSINDKGELITTKEGTKGYYELTKLLKDVLSDYNIQNSTGEKINTNTKRIYAPNIVKIEKGKAIALESGISDKQNDPYMKLSKEIKEDMKTKIKNILTK